MTNLSKQKRERMLAYLDKLKALNDDDEHIRAITEIENALNEKKYGLVWEEHSEHVDEMLEDHIPIFTEDNARKIVADKQAPYNFLLEGDNLHSLKLLEKTHKGKIDVIYIDPPYNTGAKNWKYNNAFVDSNDTFRHSKWISFMNSRLKISKKLLKEDGIIIVTIDDYEVENLILLMNNIFGEECRLGTVVIKNNPSGRSTTSGFSIAHEYALFYGKTLEAKINRLDRTEEQKARYKEEDENGPYEWVNFRARYSTNAPSLQYPIFIKNDGSDFRIPALQWDPKDKLFTLLEEVKDDEFISFPLDDSGQMRSWKWSIQTLETLRKTELSIRLNRQKKPAVYMKARMKSEGMLPLTWWDKTEYSATAYGTNLLSNLLGDKRKFNYPKSLYAVIDSIKVGSNGKTSIILDFFAGSGTTGHAVAQLNKEDGGNRTYILCTNNENNICEEVTWQRLKNIQTDLPHNLKYFKTDFIKKFDRDEAITDLMLLHIKELIELEHHIEVDDYNTVILLDEKHIADAIDRVERGGKLFLASGIFLSRADQLILEEKGVELIDIPEYYFREELREVGEL